MKQHETPPGFTLIELLVVITIIGMLAAALIGPVNQALREAEKATDQANLRWHHFQLITYQQRLGHLPQQGGHQFVLAPWIHGVCEHTDTNRDKYFSAALSEDDYLRELCRLPVDEIWKDFADVSSQDTHFAGRSTLNRRHMRSGKEVLMATDNEDGNTYLDGSVLLLRGDGDVQILLRNPDQLPYGAPADPDAAFVLAVGADSPHPDLRKLRR